MTHLRVYADVHDGSRSHDVMGAGHVMQCDMGRIHDETLGIGLGLGGHWDGFGTEHGTSHNRHLYPSVGKNVVVGI